MAYMHGEFDDELSSMGELTGKNYAQAVEDAINSWDYDTALTNHLRRTREELDTIFTAGAEKTGVSAQALENYSQALMKNSSALNGNGKALNDWEKADKSIVAAEMAVANANFAKGVQSLNKVLGESSEILYEWNEGALETWESVAKVQEALEQAFGVKVSAEFVKNNLAEIQALAQGSTDNLEALQQAAARDFVLNLDIADDAKNNFLAGLDQFIAAAEAESKGIELDVGANLNLASYTEQLNKMLEAGDITAEEVKKTFAAIGYAVDIQTTKKELTSTSHYNVTRGDGTTETWDVSTTTVTDVPYIAGENTENLGQEITTSTGDKVTVGYKKNGNGFTYTGGAKGAKADVIENLGDEAQKDIEKLKKSLKDEVDIYHEENEELERLEHNLNKIAKAKDRAWGSKKLGYMEQETEELKKQLEVNERLLSLKRDELADRRAMLAASYGATFDEYGNISNYEELRASMKNQYETLYEKARMPNDTKWMESLEEWYNTFKENLDGYEGVLEDTENISETMKDIGYSLEDLELEKIQYKLELKIELKDLEIKRLERAFDKLTDPIEDGLKMLENLTERMESTSNVFEGYKDNIIKLIPGLENIDFGAEDAVEQITSAMQNADLTNQERSALKDWIDGMGESIDSVEELYDQAFEVVSNAFEKITEEGQKATKQVEHLTSMIETYQNVIDLVGAKTLKISNETLRQLSAARVNAATSALQVAQSDLNHQKEALRQFQEAYNNATTEEEKKKWQEQIDAANESIREAESTLNSAWTGALEAAAEDFKNAVDITINEFEAAMSGVYGTFDKMREAYDQQKKLSELYVADYQKVYELSKLNRDITTSLDSTDSVKGKQVLLKLQKEINDLEKSGVKMSQYDLDYLRKKYDLRLAEIALEEAQDTKTTVRMRRDLEGNWSYVYTADESKINAAQQNYEDKLYDMMQFNQNYIDEMDAQIITNLQEMSDKIRALNVQDFESYEDYLKEVNRIKEYYGEIHAALVEELEDATNNSKILYNDDWKTYEVFTDKKVEDDGRLRLAFGDTFFALTNGYGDVTEALEGFETAFNRLQGQLKTDYSKWQDYVSGIFSIVGANIDDFAKLLAGENGKKGKVAEIVDELHKIPGVFDEDWKTKTEDGLQKIINGLKGDKFTDFQKKINDWVTAFQAIWNAYEDVTKLEIKPPAPPQKYFGTFVGVDGKTYRTSGSFDNETDAKTAGEDAKNSYWESYMQYTGDGLTKAQKLEKRGQVSQNVGTTTDDSIAIGTNFVNNTIKPPGPGDNGGGGGEGLYYGYYTLDNKKYRTKSGYETQAEADENARKEALDFVKNLINEHQYKASIGEDSDYYAYSNEQNLLNKITYSTSTQSEAFSPGELGGHNVFSIKDLNGSTVFLSKGNYSISTSGQKDEYSLSVKNGNNSVLVRSVDSNVVQDIVDHFGLSNVDEKLISGSGDLIWEDPRYERKDIIIAQNDVNGAYGDWSTMTPEQRKGRSYQDKIIRKGQPVELMWDQQRYRNAPPDSEIPVKQDGAVISFAAGLRYHVLGFDTGGYTGSWDSSGRLAMLHQKELVLNAQDTENFLAAVNIIRDIAKSIDLQAIAYQHRLAEAVQLTALGETQQALQQDIVIHAEFPNARERTEIEAAFDSLLNRASQFANRKI